MLRAGVFLAMLARAGATYECCAGGDDGCVGTKLQIGDGDCDTDDDCKGCLKCFKRSNGEPVPGCSGDVFDPRLDFCYAP